MPSRTSPRTLPAHNDECFVCAPAGSASPLTTPYRQIGSQTVEVGVRFGELHQGAPRFAHGGAVTGVLDDACGYAGFLAVRAFVTARIEVDFRRPVELGRDLVASATVDRLDGRKIWLDARLDDEASGTLLAQARALFVTVAVEHFRP